MAEPPAFPQRLSTEPPACPRRLSANWRTLLAEEYDPTVDAQRVLFVHKALKLPWISGARIREHKLGYDFTNKHSINMHGDGKEYLNLDDGERVRIDYTHGCHGHVGVAQTLDDDDKDVFHISLVTLEEGLRIIRLVVFLQVRWRWRKRRPTRRVRQRVLDLLD